jgi:hypothetical protein
MHPKVRQWTATIAAALVLAYVDTMTVSEIKDFALWQGGLVWMGVFAIGCGVLLALVNEDALWSTVAAPVLAVLIFVGVWSYVFWSFLGEYFSYLELIVSTPFLSQVLPQGFVILVTTIPMGLLGVVIATILRR